MANYDENNGINFLTFIGGDRLNIKESDYKLGFYGRGGREEHVSVGDWQTNTYLVDSREQGIAQLPWNTKFYNNSSGYLNDLIDPIKLSYIPNYQSVLNIRFITATSVKIMEAKVKLYDGTSLDNFPIGVRAKIAEIIHPGRVQVENTKNYEEWENAGSGEWIQLWKGPGEDGEYAGLYQYKRSSVNDWFIVFSISPKVVEEVTRNFGSVYVNIEYL